MTHPRCTFSSCKDPAETSITWLVHLATIARPPSRTGGNFCGAHAAMVWTKVSENPTCQSSAIIGEPLSRNQLKELK